MTTTVMTKAGSAFGFAAMLTALSLFVAPIAKAAPPQTDSARVEMAKRILEERRRAEIWTHVGEVGTVGADYFTTNAALVGGGMALVVGGTAAALGPYILLGIVVVRASAYLVTVRAEVLTERAQLLEKEFRAMVGSANADRYFREALLEMYAGSNVDRSGNTRPVLVPSHGGAGSGGAGAGAPR